MIRKDFAILCHRLTNGQWVVTCETCGGEGFGDEPETLVNEWAPRHIEQVHGGPGARAMRDYTREPQTLTTQEYEKAAIAAHQKGAPH